MVMQVASKTFHKQQKKTHYRAATDVLGQKEMSIFPHILTDIQDFRFDALRFPDGFGAGQVV